MSGSRLGRLWEFLTGIDLVMGLLWIGLVGFSVTLVVLIWTRWGQYRPLRKCLLLSMLAHLLFAGYATTIEIVTPAPLPEPVLHISYFEAPVGPGFGPGEAEGDDVGMIEAEEPAPPSREARHDPPQAAEMEKPSPNAASSPASAPPVPAPPSELPEPVRAMEPSRPLVPMPPAEATALAAERSGLEDSAVSPAWIEPSPRGRFAGRADSDRDSVAAEEALSAPLPSPSAPAAPPEVYRLRMAPDHEGIARGGGGSPETEAAVRAALAWLAENQSADGRWDASAHGAGRESYADGRNRRQAGLEADTGMTGLALLALLASGHTHLQGPHKENVRLGLEFLLRSQDAKGSLAGGADSFAQMYCHAMATFAVSEAYGMTGDARLETAVRRAVGYTAAAQDPQGGGWRYRPRDPGDTSQLGWQFMALKSAELAGLPMPERTRQGVVRFLRSVGSGKQGGLASYRPQEQATRTMTAEALVCWQFLGLAREHPACNEAGDFLLTDLPGEGPANFYYWYYGTLAMYQLQGEHWRRWNDALRPQLLNTQRKEGSLAGSWDPDAVWGGYGGRVYSTALAALCLEVYYRYLPLYLQAARQESRVK